MKEKKKIKNKSIFGIIAFVYSVMNKKDKFYFVIMSVLFALSGIFILLPAQITAILVSMISGEQAEFFGIPISSDINIVWVIILCGLLTMVPSIVFNFMGYFRNVFSMRIYLKIKERSFGWATTPRKNLNLGMTIGDATYRINNSVADVEWVMSTYFDTILPAIFSAIVSIVYLSVLEIWSMPILAIGLILVVIVFLIRQKIEGPVTMRMEKSGSKLSNFLVNTLGNLTLINIHKTQKQEQDNLSGRIEEHVNASKNRFMIWCIYWSVMAVIDAVATYLIVLISSKRVVTGMISASEVVLIISYVAKVFSPIQDFGWFLNTSTQLMTKIERLKELQPTSKTAIDTSRDSYAKPIEKITMKNVCVTNDDDTVIRDINFTIERGMLTVITGESGGGKTTSLRAIIGIAEKDSGEIILNDEYSVKSAYSFIDQFAVVMQSPFIFNRSVKDNVYYPDIEQNAYSKKVVSDFSMDKIINKKYDEDCEQEMELKLSGGEKKRICVMRGILQDKQVYIFDEPTNELDAGNTQIVVDYMNKLKENAIVMVVTHDKRMIEKADKVVTINNAIRKAENV
ncbi:MAG: ABC transporter ATP-binding protein [Clostridiales bacterium]|nr:ABC transporter ATP-binding protein [Clostridiales bacterium]